MLIPSEMAPVACLFDHLCPVRITDQYPTFPFCGGKNVCDSNLEICGIPSRGSLPVVAITQSEADEAEEALANFDTPIAFCPTSSQRAHESRHKTPDFFKPLVAGLGEYGTVLQFGFEAYPLIPGAIRMPFRGLRRLAALYFRIGFYFGVHTGDYHLMIAAGGKAMVIEPYRGTPGYDPALWRYHAPETVDYILTDNPERILAQFRTFYAASRLLSR